jgi:hypothetical protein
VAGSAWQQQRRGAPALQSPASLSNSHACASPRFRLSWHPGEEPASFRQTTQNVAEYESITLKIGTHTQRTDHFRVSTIWGRSTRLLSCGRGLTQTVSGVDVCMGQSSGYCSSHRDVILAKSCCNAAAALWVTWRAQQSRRNVEGGGEGALTDGCYRDVQGRVAPLQLKNITLSRAQVVGAAAAAPPSRLPAAAATARRRRCGATPTPASTVLTATRAAPRAVALASTLARGTVRRWRLRPPPPSAR